MAVLHRTLWKLRADQQPVYGDRFILELRARHGAPHLQPAFKRLVRLSMRTDDLVDILQRAHELRVISLRNAHSPWTKMTIMISQSSRP